MRRAIQGLVLTGAIALAASFSIAGTITGTVKDPGGAPFMGAFVSAQNAATKIAVTVLSDRSGRYHVDNLPAGEYSLRVRAVGYNGGYAIRGLALTADQNLPHDFALQPGTVRWQDLSFSQAEQLFPDHPAKFKLMTQCFACHAFQHRMAATTKDVDGWRTSVNYMNAAMNVRLNETDAENVAQYLASLFGNNSVLPRSPVEMPKWKEVAPAPVTEEATRIVYVEYEMPGPGRMPFSAAPDSSGMVWIPMAGNANKIARLDPGTGKIEEFPVPTQNRTAQVHGVFPAPDGSVWAAETMLRTLGWWDPKTRQITEYLNDAGGGSHTIRTDPKGNPWMTNPGPANNLLTRFDLETRKFSAFPGTEWAYTLQFDKDGNCWFAQYVKNGQLGKIDAKTGKVTLWPLPTADGRPRRMDIDKDGNIWTAEFQSGKVARFDPKAQTFKEWLLPGSQPGPYPVSENTPYSFDSQPGPYGFALDGNGGVWYAGTSTDTLGRLDPATGKVTVYPFPYSEITMRELFLDARGNMWWGSSGNNKVGYFYLTK